MTKGVSGAMWFVLLSVLGILVGIFMVWRGLSGEGLGSGMVLMLGIFVVIKEILDIFH